MTKQSIKSQWLLTARSPEMLAPAKIPVAAGKKMENTEKNVCPRKSGPMFSIIIAPEEDNKEIYRSEDNIEQKTNKLAGTTCSAQQCDE